MKTKSQLEILVIMRNGDYVKKQVLSNYETFLCFSSTTNINKWQNSMGERMKCWETNLKFVQCLYLANTWFEPEMLAWWLLGVKELNVWKK